MLRLSGCKIKADCLIVVNPASIQTHERMYAHSGSEIQCTFVNIKLCP